MTTSTGRSTEPRSASRSVGQWLLGLLIVLAVAASILMIVTDNLSITGSLAVIAALWAAVIGAILVTRFRKQAENADAKSRDLRLVYELQLEREISARRQYELDVEATIRKEVAEEAGVELAALREQVISLRASLERLLGEPLPEDQVALPNEKLRELASGIGGPAYSGGFGTGFGQDDLGRHDDGTIAARDFAQTAPTSDEGRHQQDPDVDPNELTEVIPVVTDDPLSGRIATAPEHRDADDPQLPEPDGTAPPEAGAPAYPGYGSQGSYGGYAVSPYPAGGSPGYSSQPAGGPTYAGGGYVGGGYDYPSGDHLTGDHLTGAEGTDTGGAPVEDWVRGRHKASAAPEAASSAPVPAVAPEVTSDTDVPQADGTDGHHANGRPFSELARQLRGTGGGGGRRRRRD
ncbi:MAG: hypothetical protein QM662_08660 [Gordonia sp. (in: high G+C Gram-positive bacteria)]